MTAVLSPGAAPPAATHARALELRHVSKRFDLDGRTLEVLKNFNLSVEAGGFLSIVGASGCGKTTLLRLLAGLEPASEGQILAGGVPVNGPSLARGIVFQDHRLFPWLTVEQNIAAAFEASTIPRAARASLVREHIALVGLAGFERAYPHQLSGGMAQRAAIARVLVNQPDILLLDEPLAALDAFTRLRLQRELQRIWLQKRITMVLVTHDIDEAIFLGDRIVILQPHPGRIRRTVDVGLPHPRDRDDPAFIRLRHEIYQEFE